MSSKRLHAASRSSTETQVCPTKAEQISKTSGNGKVIEGSTRTSLRLIVAVVVLDAVVLLRAFIVRQFQYALAVSDWIDAISRLLGSLGPVAEEVESEASLLLLRGTLQGHAHNVLVELERLLIVLDSDHGVIHAVGGDIRLLALGLIDRVLRNDLDPVIVGVQGESNGTHAAIFKTLLERVAGV